VKGVERFMAVIIIETTEKNVETLRRLELEYGNWQGFGRPVIDRHERAGRTELICRFEPAKDTNSGEELFLRFTANALSDVIVNEWEELLLRRRIRTRYNYFSSEEQSIICRYARKSLAAETEGEAIPAYKIRQKEEIMTVLLDYLATYRYLNIGGFIIFRLREYCRLLRDAVESAVDEFFLEREYTEFIRLLRYFVSIQEPKVEEVHVIVKAAGVFQMYGGDRELLGSECFEETADQGEAGDINLEDLLISALVTVAPRRVTVHYADGQEQPEITAMIKDVFGPRALFCFGCKLCRTRPAERAAGKAPQNLR
jgi:putative sporulation protein YtxC